jgi:hypothetical protein
MTYRPWPFPSPLGSRPEQEQLEDVPSDSTQCECERQITVSELASGRCASCGKSFS